MLFSGIKRIPGPWWHGFDSQHVHVMVPYSRISDPEQFLPPRDPDGVATFCRPATRATQRPCQPWMGGKPARRRGPGRSGERMPSGD